ncbi:MAG: 30S ribosomal protein S16 [Spirochaetales bacterium]|nr:30S ribosomal protein S16 [Spirochaetales bacterium]
MQRYGARNNPFYRIVAADSRHPRDGRFIEQLGHYNPVQPAAQASIKKDRVEYWLKHGAQPTPSVKTLLRKTEV